MKKIKTIIVIVMSLLIISMVGCANSNFEDGNIEEANKIISKINKEYVEYSIKDDVNDLKSKIDEKVKMQEEIDNSIEQIKELVKNKSYNEAKILIEELNKKELNENDKKEIEDIRNFVDSKIVKIEE